MGDLGRVRKALTETISKMSNSRCCTIMSITAGHAALRMCIVLREMAATMPPLFSFISKCDEIACTVAAIHSQTHMQ